MNTPFILSNDTLTMFVGNQPHTTTQSNPNWEKLMACVKNEIKLSDDDLVALLNPVKALKIDHDRVRIGSDCLYVDDKPCHSYLADRIMQMSRQGLDVTPWINFLDRLLSNPSKQVYDDLFLWMEGAKMPVTPEGKFLAYKKVRDDYKSFHDGTTSHTIGQRLEMPRREVDDRRENTCSTGLHFCGWDYLDQYQGGQGRVLVLEIDPAEVVSIPVDYNHQKGRAMGYTPIGEVEAPHAWPKDGSHPYADMDVYDRDKDGDYEEYIRITRVHPADEDVSEGNVYVVVSWSGKCPIILDDAGDEQLVFSDYEIV